MEGERVGRAVNRYDPQPTTALDARPSFGVLATECEAEVSRLMEDVTLLEERLSLALSPRIEESEGASEANFAGGKDRSAAVQAVQRINWAVRQIRKRLSRISEQIDLR